MNVEEDPHRMANLEEMDKTDFAQAPPERSHRPAQQKVIKRLRAPEDEDPATAEYARLLEAYDTSFRSIAEGEVVKGTVLKVTDTEVIVDVGYKSEGIIAIDEFLDENGVVTVEAGDLVDVWLFDGLV